MAFCGLQFFERKMIRSANPALDSKTFCIVKGYGQESMSLQGVVNKTIFFLIVLVSSALLLGPNIDLKSKLVFITALAGVLSLAVLTMVFKHWASILGLLFSIVIGAVMGSLVAGIETRYPGIAIQATGLTVATMGSLLFLYKTGFISPNENLKLIVASGTMAVFIVYSIHFGLSAAGMDVLMFHESGWAGMLFSLFALSMAALNLVMDFDFIEEGVRTDCEKSMEWYAAFSLVITLVWLYFEFIHLLSKARE